MNFRRSVAISLLLIITGCGKEPVSEKTVNTIGMDSIQVQTATPISKNNAIESSIVGIWRAKIDLNERYKNVENAGVSDGNIDADFSFDAVMEFKEDNTAVLNFDIEAFYDNMYAYMDEHYTEVLRKSMESYGLTGDKLEEYAKQNGFDSGDEMFKSMKEVNMASFDAAMRGDGKTASIDPVDLTWQFSDMGELLLTSKSNYETKIITFNEDGSFTLTLQIDELGDEVQMVFVKE